MILGPSLTVLLFSIVHFLGLSMHAFIYYYLLISILFSVCGVGCFQCNDDTCINETLTCNGNVDCSDGEDEDRSTLCIGIKLFHSSSLVFACILFLSLSYWIFIIACVCLIFFFKFTIIVGFEHVFKE